MFSITSNNIVNTKKRKKYDLPYYYKPDEIKNVLQQKLDTNTVYAPTSGDSSINPYKDAYDMIKAENRVMAESFKKSILWSPKYKPTHFKWLFCIPMSFIFGFCVYIHKIQMPRNMMKMKKSLGCRFPENDAKGTFNSWEQEAYIDEIYGDIFQKEELDAFQNEYPDLTEEGNTLKRGSEFRSKMAYQLQEIALENIYGSN